MFSHFKFVSTRPSLYLMISLGLALVFILLSILKFDAGWYTNNDGVTLACAHESMWKLFHPGLQSVWGCTYDHQPLYFVFVKIISTIFGAELLHFQIFNVICLALGLVVLTQELRHHTSAFYALALPFFFCSSWFVLGHLQEIRMYSFYLMTCLFLQTMVLRFERGVSPSLHSGLIHLMGYLNFFLYLVPLFGYLLVIKNKINRYSIDFKILLFTSLLFVLIKLPFIIWWRVYMRSGDTHFKQHGLLESFELLFYGPTSFYWLSLLLFSVAVGHQITQAKTSPLARFNLGLILFTLLFILVTKNIFKMHEVDFRYFLYLVPVLITSSALALNKIRGHLIAAFISLLFMIVALNSHRHMFQTFNPKGQNKEAAQFYTQLTTDGQRIFLTEDKHFLQNYLGIFGQLENGIRPLMIEFKELSEDSQINDKVGAQHVVVTLISELEKHQAYLLSRDHCYQTTIFENNFFSYQTIFSVSVECPQVNKNQ